MSTLSWNCRGLGNHRTVQALRSTVEKEVPILVFLMETKIPRKQQHKMKEIQNSIGFTQGLIVPSEGRSGGLALLWKPETFVNIRGYSKWFIDAEVVCGNVQGSWRFTGFYGQPDTSKREETWQILEAFGHSNVLPWLCIGDYNEILSNSEKLGGQLRPARQMDRFREIVDLCQFRDLGYTRARYTWSRHFENGDSVWARLDRALANEEWMRKFANARVVHISTIESDHCMLCLQWGHDTRNRMNTGKLFRFEAMWLRDPRCPEVVSDAWERGLSLSSGFPIHNCLHSCREALKRWNKLEFGHVGRRISALQAHLQRLEQQPELHGEEIRSVRKELGSWLDTEEVMWQQRSRNMYLVAGDRNTRFFHVKASNRNQKNTIVGMEDSSGTWQETPEAIEQIVTDYFSMC